jgi:hypothetical protein
VVGTAFLFGIFRGLFQTNQFVTAWGGAKVGEAGVFDHSFAGLLFFFPRNLEPG